MFQDIKLIHKIYLCLLHVKDSESVCHHKQKQKQGVWASVSLTIDTTVECYLLECDTNTNNDVYVPRAGSFLCAPSPEDGRL